MQPAAAAEARAALQLKAPAAFFWGAGLGRGVEAVLVVLMESSLTVVVEVDCGADCKGKPGRPD